MQKAGELRSIIQFKPMDMIEMDFMGPISPSCTATGYSYICIVIVYCSRFLWAIGVKKADQASTIMALLDYIFPIMGWPLTVYSDNGSHFTRGLISDMWRDYGVMHFASAISHPQSVGLSERYVQMLRERIRLACRSLGSTQYYSHEIRKVVLAINTRCIRIHEYTPANILLGFNPTMTHKIEQRFDSLVKGDNLTFDPGPMDPEESCLTSYVIEREERGISAGGKLSMLQDCLSSHRSHGYRKPAAGDLVLVRDF